MREVGPLEHGDTECAEVGCREAEREHELLAWAKPVRGADTRLKNR
jgi:hypothetical protein